MRSPDGALQWSDEERGAALGRRSVPLGTGKRNCREKRTGQGRDRVLGGVLSNSEYILPTSCAVTNDHHPLLGAKFLLVADEWHRPVQFRGEGCVASSGHRCETNVIKWRQQYNVGNG